MNTFSYDNDNGTEYDDNELYGDDEVLEADDSLQEDKDRDVQLGKTIAREKKYHGALVRTVSATPLDADLLPVPEQDVAKDDQAETERPIKVSPKAAKQQMKDKLAAAQARFGKLPKEPKAAANDNFRPIVSWPLMDQLTRRTFEPDYKRRTKVIATARYIRELIDMGSADALGNDSDCDMQRTQSGKVWFEQGLTLDRKKVIYDEKNGESDAERYSGSVRTAKKSLPVGNGLNCNDPFPVRVIEAREELDAIAAAVGPMLWPSLLAAISENATMTNIGLALGVKRFQAPREGTAIIRRALTAAMEALGRLNEVKDEPARTTPLPDKSRGHFLNQTRNHVRAA